MTSRHRSSALVLAALLPLAACGGDDEADPPRSAPPPTTAAATTTTPPPTTTTTPPTPEQEVEAAYLAIMERSQDRALDPDPADPTLAEDFSGEALLKVTAYLTTFRDEGRSISYPNGRRPRTTVIATQVQGQVAVVRNCTVDDAVVIGRDGAVVNDDVATTLLRSHLVRREGRWRLDRQEVLQRWMDGKGCQR